MVKILLICGSSGCGKTYIENLLKNHDYKVPPHILFNKLEQVTTRKPRSEKEIEDKIYRFLSEEQYKKISKLLIAKTNVKGKSYGTLNTIMESDDNYYQVVNTIIVNRLGWNNVMEDLETIYGNEADICTLRITCNNKDLEERELRDTNYTNKEDNLLKDIADITLDNSKSNRLDENKVIEALIEYGFLDEGEDYNENI